MFYGQFLESCYICHSCKNCRIMIKYLYKVVRTIPYRYPPFFRWKISLGCERNEGDALRLLERNAKAYQAAAARLARYGTAAVVHPIVTAL